MRLLTCTALACLWPIPGREFTETMDYVVLLKAQVQFPLGNTGLLTEGLEVSFQGLKAKVQDRWNKVRSGAEFCRDEWFALYKDDWGIDDGTWIDNVYRGLFRLHPGTLSEGCITIAHDSDYALIRNALMSTELIQVPCMRSLMARGWVEVIESGYTNTCP